MLSLLVRLPPVQKLPLCPAVRRSSGLESHTSRNTSPVRNDLYHQDYSKLETLCNSFPA